MADRKRVEQLPNKVRNRLAAVYAQQDELRRRAAAAYQAMDRPLAGLPVWFAEPMVVELEREAAVCRDTSTFIEPSKNADT